MTISRRTMRRMHQAPGPWLIDHTTPPWPLHGKAATRAAEAAALLVQEAPHTLMARAGWAVARLAMALAPHARHAWVAAGPGNNGGDGLVAALHLKRAGWEVTVSLLGDDLSRPLDATWALQQARDAGVDIQTFDGSEPAGPTGAGLVIDALLGVGTSREPQEAMARCIQAVNAHAAPVLAVDLPSGLDADTGASWGANTVRATATLSLLTLKPGLFTAQGRDHSGAIWLDTLGVDVGAGNATLHGPVRRQPRLHAANKGSHGDVAVVAGAAGMTGAAWLAARAALAAGAGRVYVSLLDEDLSSVDMAQPELMLRQRFWLSAPDVLAQHTVVCGCGGGSAVAQALPPLLAHAARLVLDADALNAVAQDTTLAGQLRHRQARGLPTVLTPHPLEAARLLGISTAQVQSDRLAAAQALSEALQCAVLLKGSGTVTAAPGALPFINPTGNASLAGPGTGDVLAGWLAGRWAQAANDFPQSVAAAAAWEHGRAADDFEGARWGWPLRASALIEVLGGGDGGSTNP